MKTVKEWCKNNKYIKCVYINMKIYKYIEMYVEKYLRENIKDYIKNKEYKNMYNVQKRIK